jgi:hypothetical protein
MGALSFAFDTIIVGALALPWLVLAVDLFFPTEESRIEALLSFVKVNPAAAGVLLLAMAYFLGSAVSRIAQDFFNDDDLGVPVTEENIRTTVYCSPDPNEPWLFVIGISPQVAPISLCDNDSKNKKNQVRRVFHLQESTLLLEGEDKTERLRQLHQQIMVLRGAAFNGLVAFALCFFGWCAKHRLKGRLFLALAPLIVLLAGVYALSKHIHGRVLDNPPYMEFTLLVLGLAGSFALWKGAQKNYGASLVLSLLLTPMAWLAWWWTEVLYDEQVIYSFYALNHILPK